MFLLKLMMPPHPYSSPQIFFGKSPKESQLLFIFPPETRHSLIFLRTLVPSAHILTELCFVHELIILNFINDRDILSKKSPLLDVLLHGVNVSHEGTCFRQKAELDSSSIQLADLVTVHIMSQTPGDSRRGGGGFFDRLTAAAG